MRISLSAEDFDQLVAGHVVAIDGIEIALCDIGFARMREAISRADPETMAAREERTQAWATRRRISEYMAAHPGVSRTEAHRAVLGGK